MQGVNTCGWGRPSVNNKHYINICQDIKNNMIYRRPKYRAIRTKIDGISFDSKAESYHYLILRALLDSEKIDELKVHPRYPIRINSVLVCHVELDFEYKDEEGNTHYVDVKGTDTAMSKLKRKMVEAYHNITVEIVKVRQN